MCWRPCEKAYKRPNMLQRNIASIANQTDGECIHTLLVDEQGVGVAGAWAKLRDYAPRLAGDYIWILDDDDECVRPSLVEDLKAIAVGRLLLDNIPHIKSYWIMIGPRLAQVGLPLSLIHL